MKLKELKAIVVSVDADNLRLAGFCDEYSKMPEKNQLMVIEESKNVCIFSLSIN